VTRIRDQSLHADAAQDMTFTYRRIDFVTQGVIKDEMRTDLPVVSQPKIVGVPPHRTFTNAISLWKIQPAHGGGK